jgi:hypothetical protein
MDLFFHIKFNDTIDNATTRMVLVAQREIKITIYRTLNFFDNNPNIAQRTTLKRHINLFNSSSNNPNY